MSESESKIVFYDLASTKPDFPWSPNTWKIRLTLNYKRIPYKTVWIEYPDIEGICKGRGIAPTSTKPDGRPHYTVPSIWDPSTKTGVSESYRIAEYLDKTYPDTPPVLFDGIEEYDQVINAFFGVPELLYLFPLSTPFLYPLLNPASQGFKRAEDPLYGVDVEKIFPTSKEREEAWKEVQKGFDILDGLLQKEQKKGGPFSRGEQVSFVEFVIGGFLMVSRLLWGEDSEYWRDMATWNGGRWGRLIKRLEEYTVPAAGTK